MTRANARITRSRSSSLDRVTLIILIVFIVLAIITAVVAFTVARNFFVSTNVISVGDAPPVLPNGSSSANGTVAGTQESTVTIPEGPLQSASDPTRFP